LFKEIILLSSKVSLKCIKCDSKDIYIYNATKRFKINSYFELLFIEESRKKCITVATKILSKKKKKTGFILIHINNKKCFLSSKSAYQNDF